MEVDQFKNTLMNQDNEEPLAIAQSSDHKPLAIKDSPF